MARPVTKAFGSIEPTAVEQVLTLILQRVIELRQAGVTSLSIDGVFAITLGPPAPSPGSAPKPEEMPWQHIDPLRDPSTYPGGRVPGFTREDERAFE